MKELATENENTWCPGCHNFMLLQSVKMAVHKLITQGWKHDDFVMVTGIGCHAKVFDYLHLSGFYGLHGRTLPVGLGIKIGNPNLHVVCFAGDGDMYAEGIEHFVHAGRYNANITLIVHNNQAFSLTTGQSTPTTQKGYKHKASPLGEFNKPLNPMKIALASGMTFVARCHSLDIAHTAEIIERAFKHKGFAFVEVLEDCIIFNKTQKVKERMYKVDNNIDWDKAMKNAEEYDYDDVKSKIAVGVLYEKNEETFEEKWPQLKELVDKKVGWAGFGKQ